MQEEPFLYYQPLCIYYLFKIKIGKNKKEKCKTRTMSNFLYQSTRTPAVLVLKSRFMFEKYLDQRISHKSHFLLRSLQTEANRKDATAIQSVYTSALIQGRKSNCSFITSGSDSIILSLMMNDESEFLIWLSPCPGSFRLR